MTATMVEQATQKMSAIFPTQPNKSTIHLLPKGAEMITYSVSDTLWIMAWMPDGYRRVQQEYTKSNDAFYNEFCEECRRNCFDFLSEYEDEGGEIDWDHPDLRNHCSVYDNGYSGQKCPEGNELEDETVDFNLAPMVFGISLNIHSKTYRFERCTDTAYFCAGRVDSDGAVLSTDITMAANVFGSEDYPEGICWGNNDRPETLRGIVESYFATPFNSDLLPLADFEENSNYMRRNSQSDKNYHLDVDENLLCKGSPDALMLLDAEQNVSSFFQMLTAGYKSLDKAPHIMMIPLFESKIEKNGYTFDGYLTSLDDVGKHWFVTHDGLIIGQV